MKDRILQTLCDLRAYALSKRIEAAFLFHEEDSSLVRFANSAVSLNTNERLIRLAITAYADHRRASYEMITSLASLEEMKQGVDAAAEMARLSMPLSYQPNLPNLPQTFADETGFDPALGSLSGAEQLAYFNTAVEGLEGGEISLSGIFSSGTNVIAQISTRSDHTQYFKTSDAQVSIVLSHTGLKWEVRAGQSAQQKNDLDPVTVRGDLAFLLERYQNDPPVQLPVGRYDIVFGPAATSTLLDFMDWIGFSGGMMKRGISFLSEAHLGRQVFSPRFTLTDDPTRRETFPFRRDFYGIPRDPFPIFTKGVFQAFTWNQDDADEFGARPTGHSVMHNSLALSAGDMPARTLVDLARQPRDGDLLYIPALHYPNVVNPSKGLVTASSRFGALLLKKDGSLSVPYNVRLTQSLLDIFGDRLAWMSAAQAVQNTSSSYYGRNPSALVVPALARVNDLEISHSNSSY